MHLEEVATIAVKMIESHLFIRYTYESLLDSLDHVFSGKSSRAMHCPDDLLEDAFSQVSIVRVPNMPSKTLAIMGRLKILRTSCELIRPFEHSSLHGVAR